jgi:hypothetical protein
MEVKSEGADNKIFLKPGKIVTWLFWATVICFLLIFIAVLYIGSPIGPYSAAQFAGTLYFPFIIIFVAFSVSTASLVYSIRQRLEKLFKSFLILKALSAVGFSISFFLRTLIFGLLNETPFWHNIISTYNITLNTVFAIFIGFLFPLGFIVGMIVSIILFITRRNIKSY